MTSHPLQPEVQATLTQTHSVLALSRYYVRVQHHWHSDVSRAAWRAQEVCA